jgi:L-ascorbate metabolism protein UlaG (beta-lactamase superfamily)
MKAISSRACVVIGIAAALISIPGSLMAAPEFTRIQLLTNREAALQFSVETGSIYRIDTSTSLPDWTPLVSLTGAVTSLQHTDSAAPYLDARFYRAEQLTGTNILIGDFLSTTNGDVIIQPRFHATFVMSWNGKMIYNDPDNDATYTGLPKADLILISHTHSDHFNTNTIDAARKADTVIIGSQSVYNSLTPAQKALAIVLGYGASTNVLGLNVQAVHAYNGNHTLNFGNGYVVTIGGKRIYISGDTGDVPEIRVLPDIDVAFLCMNPTFTMSVNQATNVIRSMRPKIVYPYHYRDSNATTNAAFFKQRLGTDLGIEVRLRKWY